MSKLSARIRNLEFHDDMPIGSTGFLITPEGFAGWDDGVDMRRQMVELQAAHGSYDLRGYLDSRVVSISGVCVADSPEQLGWFRSQLTGLLADGDSARLTVDHQGVTTWADVRLASKTKFVVRAANPTFADFQVQFWAADPRRYGDSHTYTGSSVDVCHYGNFPASPVITVAGSGNNTYWVNGPDGRRWEVTADLQTGHPHTLDIRTGRLIVDGFVIFGGLNRADVWAVPGGTKVNHSFDVNGNTATMSIRLTDTYL